MKRLFTLVALMACFLGAKAEWVNDYSIDYSTYSDFPFYIMGYAPDFIDGVMVDNPVPYRKLWRSSDPDFPGEDQCTEITINGSTYYYQMFDECPDWGRQYFIADGIKTELDGSYTVKAMVRATEAVTFNVNMGWGWGTGQQASASVTIPASSDFIEVEWEYSGIGGTPCNLVAQPGLSKAVIEWKSLTVSHNAKPMRPVTWQEWLTSDGQPVTIEKTSADIPTYMGNAETPWPSWAMEGNPNETWKGDKTGLICAWGKTKGRNLGPSFDGTGEGFNPFPADIENDPADETNKVFVVHGAVADTEGDASAWDNQFWIQSPKAWKSGDQVKIHFRYKASADVSSTDTQIHYQNPSNYLIWHAVGNIHFTTEWQEYDDIMTIADDMSGGWSIAFNLNSVVKDAVTFYFDDLSWQSMVLDEGYFVAGCNTATGLEYDFDNAIEFTDEDEDGVFEAVIGEKGNKDSYVSQIMISTIRGNDTAFKNNTLKPAGTDAIKSDPDAWLDYSPASLAKLNLSGSGVWKIYLDPEYKSMAFEMLEGEAKEALDVVTNPYEITVNALERDWKPADNDGNPVEAEIGTGQPWDNQFWIVANRVLDAGEATVVSFKYKATKEAKASTQSHAAPGDYIHWGAIGDVNFTTDWQTFEADFTIPSECAGKGMKSIAFNLSEIKDANDYEFKDFQWYLKGDEEGKTMENLINAEGGENFFFKVLGGEISQDIVEIGNTIKATNVIYNMAGQRVSKNFKGIVVKNGNKYVVK